MAGVAFGVGSALLANVFLLAVPAWPGAIVASAFTGRSVFGDILTDHGACLELLIPANAAFYGLVGAMFGLGRAIWPPPDGDRSDLAFGGASDRVAAVNLWQVLRREKARFVLAEAG